MLFVGVVGEEGAWGEKEGEEGNGWEGREVWEGEAVGKAGRRGGKVGGKGRGPEEEGRENHLLSSYQED